MGIINRRLKAMKAGEPTNNDLLGILLESNYKESEKNNGGGMSLRDVVEEVKLFYLAGQEANAELLVWTMLLLSKHPEWQAKAREEILKVFGSEKPDYDKLGQLKVVSFGCLTTQFWYILVKRNKRKINVFNILGGKNSTLFII